jgi:hypothetical protein
MDKISLTSIAGILKVHPRTVVRALGGADSSYWAHPDVTLAEIALAYGVSLDDLTGVIKDISKDRDALMTVKEAAEFVNDLDGPDVSIHTIRRRYPKFIWTSGVIRYLKSHVVEHYIEHSA